MLTDRNLNLEEKVRELRETVGDLVWRVGPDLGSGEGHTYTCMCVESALLGSGVWRASPSSAFPAPALSLSGSHERDERRAAGECARD